MAEEHPGGRGHEQSGPSRAAPGMYLDPESGLVLPQGVRLASREEVARAWFLGFALFVVTLGIGYVTWSQFEWGRGRTPAQRMLGLRCWLPGPRRVAGRARTATRQITGFLLNGQLLSGVFLWLASENLRSVGDLFAGTVILHDPDGVLRLPPAGHPVPGPLADAAQVEVRAEAPGAHWPRWPAARRLALWRASPLAAHYHWRGGFFPKKTAARSA